MSYESRYDYEQNRLFHEANLAMERYQAGTGLQVEYHEAITAWLDYAEEAQRRHAERLAGRQIINS